MCEGKQDHIQGADHDEPLDALVDMTKPFAVEEQRADQEQEADQEQREDAALEVDVPRNPFDRKDFLLFMIPIVVIVFAMWEGASQ